MTLDLTPPITTVTVNDGTDDLDCTNAFESLLVDAPLFDDSGWFSLQGTLRLGQVSLAESLDCRDNPTRWAVGNRVTVTCDFGNGAEDFPLPLYILRLPTLPQPDRRYIDIPVGTQDALQNYSANPGTPGGISYGTITARTGLANDALTLAGLPALQDTMPDWPLPASVFKTDGGSWRDYVGKLAYSAGYVLHVDGTGTRATKLDLDSLTTAFKAFTVGQNEAEYSRDDPDLSAPTTVTAFSNGSTYTTVTDECFTNTYTVDGSDLEVEVCYTGRGSNVQVVEETRRGPVRFLGIPGDGEFTNPETEVTLEVKTTTSTYNAGNGRLETRVIEIERPQGVVFPGREFVTPVATRITAQRTTITPVYATSSTYLERRITVQEPFNADSPSTLSTAQVDIERWEPAGTGSDEYLYSRSIDNLRPDASVLSGINPPNTLQRPPQTEYRPPSVQRVPVTFQSTRTFEPGSSGKPLNINIPGGMAASNAQCGELAETQGRIRHGRQWSITWGLPLTEEWFTDFTPLPRIDATRGSTRISYLGEGLSFEITPRSATVAGSGIELGSVELDGTGTPDPVFTVFDTAEITITCSSSTVEGSVVPAGTVEIEITSPASTVDGTVVPQGTAEIEITSPASTVDGTVSSQGTAEIAITTPTSTVDGTVVPQGTAEIAITTPASTVDGTIDDDSALSFPGLIHYYKLTQTTGDYVDSHGAADLTINGTTGATRTSNGIEFDGTGNYTLSRSALNFGDVDYYFALWIRVDDKTDFAYVLNERSGSEGFGLILDNSSSEAFEYTHVVSNSFLRNISSEVLVNSTVYFVEFYYDASADETGIAVTASTESTVNAFDTRASTGIYGSTSGADFVIGAFNTSGFSKFDGRISELAIADTLPSDLTTISTFRNALFNSGVPLTYEDLSPS